MKDATTTLTALAATVIMAWCLPGPVAAGDWWGHRLDDTPSQFIFGYGSLINAESRNATAGSAVPAMPVRVAAAFGYVRTWNDRSPSGFTALGLRKPRAGEPASTINGVLYPVEGNDLAKFDAREAGYARIKIPMDEVEAVSWQGLPQRGDIWVYVPVNPKGVPGEDLPEPDASFPLLESYIDVVVEGGLDYGADFAKELVETTADWSRYWLNDREFARRPWVHDPKAAAVDALIAATAPAARHFGDRAFAEAFARRWQTEMRP